jgi:hypothetical protein
MHILTNVTSKRLAVFLLSSTLISSVVMVHLSACISFWMLSSISVASSVIDDWIGVISWDSVVSELASVFAEIASQSWI